MSTFKSGPIGRFLVWARRPWGLIVIAAIILIGLIVIWQKNGDGEGRLVRATRGEVIQKVNITGKTQPAENVDLAFEKSGKISAVPVKVGDEVSKGAILVALDTSELNAQLIDARANLDAQTAKLEELRRGVRPEEIKISETKETNAQVSLTDALNNLKDRIFDASTKSDDGVRGKTDVIFSNPRTAPDIIFFVSDSVLESELQFQRLKAETILKEWSASLGNLSIVAVSGINSYISQAKNNLNQVKLLLDKAALAVNGALADDSLTTATIDGWKTSISTARSNINTAIAALIAAEEKFRTAEATLALAENELALNRAGTAAEQVLAQEAVARQADANVRLINSQIAKNILRAPIAGVVTKQDAKVGEIAAPNTVVVSIDSADNLEIEAHIPEINVTKVSVDNPVRIKFDALPEKIFTGRIVSVEPGETIIDGVVNFKVKISFETEGESLKSGLTANLDIETARSEGVLLPIYAIDRDGDGYFVKKVKTDGREETVRIEPGLRGQDGNIQILSGVLENEEVINLSL